MGLSAKTRRLMLAVLGAVSLAILVLGLAWETAPMLFPQFTRQYSPWVDPYIRSLPEVRLGAPIILNRPYWHLADLRKRFGDPSSGLIRMATWRSPPLRSIAIGYLADLREPRARYLFDKYKNSTDDDARLASLWGLYVIGAMARDNLLESIQNESERFQKSVRDLIEDAQ